jgi:hypothetical protein
MSARAPVRVKTDNRTEVRSSGTGPRASYFQEPMGKHLPDLRSFEKHNGRMKDRNNRVSGPNPKEPKVEGPVPSEERIGRRNEQHWVL